MKFLSNFYVYLAEASQPSPVGVELRYRQSLRDLLPLTLADSSKERSSRLFSLRESRGAMALGVAWEGDSRTYIFRAGPAF